MSHRPARKVDLVSILRQTDWAKSALESTVRRAREATEDPRKAERLAKPECVVCYYIYPDRIGGAMVTTTDCGVCGTRIGSGNTNVDVVCPECAKANDLCRHCGADLKLRVRRKTGVKTH